jgi:hypothetical protein
MDRQQPGAANGDGPLRYLSDRWLDAADRALADLEPIPESLTMGVTVVDGPDGVRSYRLVFGPDRVGIDRVGTGRTEAGTDTGDGRAADTDVRMTLTWATAVAIANGQASAQRAFLDGDIQFGGDASVLLGHQDRFAAVDDRLAALRAGTDFGPGFKVR